MVQQIPPKEEKRGPRLSGQESKTRATGLVVFIALVILFVVFA